MGKRCGCGHHLPAALSFISQEKTQDLGEVQGPLAWNPASLPELVADTFQPREGPDTQEVLNHVFEQKVSQTGNESSIGTKGFRMGLK